MPNLYIIKKSIFLKNTRSSFGSNFDRYWKARSDIFFQTLGYYLSYLWLLNVYKVSWIYSILKIVIWFSWIYLSSLGLCEPVCLSYRIEVVDNVIFIITITPCYYKNPFYRVYFSSYSIKYIFFNFFFFFLNLFLLT